jgi:cobalt/nickel transport system permease protein
MHHEYIDKYSRLDSIIHRMDARFKIVTFTLLVVLISFAKRYYVILEIMPFVILGLIISKIPFHFILRRLSLCLPFLIFLFLLPVSRALLLFTKAVSSITILLLLASTTRFDLLTRAMEKLKFPKLFVMMLSFFYRYIFLFIDDLHHMKQALEARCVCKRLVLERKTASNLLGSLIVRSYEQSERIYYAMLARGYADDSS